MVLTTTKAKPLMESALTSRSLRQDMIAGNIANIDTPFYKSRDIDFESALIEKTKLMYENKETKELKMAQTDDKHMSAIKGFDSLKSTIYLRDGHMARNDANTVDLDVETTELGKNSIMFNALTAALKKNSQIFKSVLDASGKV
ncbi:MAG: flagellar basal body rod protein FlgB [Sulfurospirillum sp.]|nr:flagellar basal body rod protein FlgB [Sulfurospirillum sp.]MBL0702524.1 flagellar basal body rod protein FlgB [Sulfurospirillum sp.]